MKRLIILLLTAITLAVMIGSLAYYYGPGYVVFNFAEYTIETSFIFMVGLFVISFIIFYYSLRFLSGLLRIPAYMSLKHRQRQAERSKNALVKGLIEMSEGRFEHAEKVLLKQLNEDDNSALLNYLMAARAAQQQGAYDRRDEYLRLAHESTPSADIAIGLTQAELQLSHKQFEQALATLNHLSSVSPRHSYVKKLQSRAYQQLEDWDSLSQILDDVRKLKSLDDTQFKQLELDAYLGMLKTSIRNVDGDKVEQIWRKLPKHLKSSAELLALYTAYLQQQKKDTEAETLIRNYLSDTWHDDLAYRYSELNGSDCKRQLETAETWLHNQPRNALLLLILGKLCLKCELWGKARNYFETSISIKPLAEAYLKLAQLLEDKMDEHDAAEQMYQQGLSVAVAAQLESKCIDITPTSRSRTPQLKVIQS